MTITIALAIGLVIGLVLGTTFGFLIASMFILGKRTDEQELVD